MMKCIVLERLGGNRERRLSEEVPIGVFQERFEASLGGCLRGSEEVLRCFLERLGESPREVVKLLAGRLI